MNRKFRIISSDDYKRVRRLGKPYAHPLAVIIVTEGQAQNSRAGIITGKSIGKAVQRNRVKRRLRAILSNAMVKTRSPYDIVVIARNAINAASFAEIRSMVLVQLRKAGILEYDDGR